jgi:nitrate/TMAO reductase-like tetraheme cytochrome c subunit
MVMIDAMDLAKDETIEAAQYEHEKARTDSAPRCPDCHSRLIYEQPRDENGKPDNWPYYWCSNCDYRERA